MATEIIAYVAVSLDGYIAEADGRPTFLDEFGSDEYDFHGFFDTIDGLVMGATTYERALGFGWPYGDMPTLVLTSRDLEPPEGAPVVFSNAPTGSAIRTFAEGVNRRVWVVGGGRVITDGMNDGAIESLELFVMPVALGSGVPLFPDRYDGVLELDDSRTFSNGVVQLVYTVKSRDGREPRSR